MEQFSTYTLMIGATSVILLSFLFSSVARRTNVPAIIVLLALGVGLQFLLVYAGIEIDFFPFLEVLGLVGMYMIVLEAALNLKLRKSKAAIILKSLIITVLGLAASTAVAATILYYIIGDLSWTQVLLYATPLSIMTSAIIIPGTRNLRESKKDFHLYESSFSEILGIMLFYFFLWMFDPTVEHGLSGEGQASRFFINSAETIGIALVTSYVVLFLFQKIEEKTELFVLLSILLLLYAVSKELSLSPLIIIVVFGVVMSNMELFFRGPLRKLIKPDTFTEMQEGLHVLTNDTSFIVRIFFFVIFGASIVLISLLDLKFLLISGMILISIYVIRWVLIRVFIGRNVYPQVWIAPRGLITILLFYAIPTAYQTELFNPGILLFIIIFSGLAMTAGKISHKMKREEEMDEKEGSAAAEFAEPYLPPVYAPTVHKTDNWMERGVSKVRNFRNEMRWKITHHPLYIVQKRRLNRFITVSLRTLGVQLIFNPETKRFSRRVRNVIAILRNPAQRVNLKKNQDYQNIKKYINRIIFETDTLEGLLFDIGLFVLIFLSVIIVMLGSMSEVESVWGQTLRVLDWIITIMFTIEYALRIWTTTKPRKYIFSFFGMVDLLSILPLYAEVIFSGLYSLEIIRVIRLVRIFRVLKLIRFVSEADTILRSLKASANKIFVFLFFVLIVCSILGSLMFIVEGPESGFNNIPQGIYWAVVTLTTVGYGDIYPITGLGRLIAMLLMVMGYGVIAVPTGLVAAGVMSEARSKYSDKVHSSKSITCPVCHEQQPATARYCNNCGSELSQEPAGPTHSHDPPSNL